MGTSYTCSICILQEVPIDTLANFDRKTWAHEAIYMWIFSRFMIPSSRRSSFFFFPVNRHTIPYTRESPVTSLLPFSTSTPNPSPHHLLSSFPSHVARLQPWAESSQHLAHLPIHCGDVRRIKPPKTNIHNPSTMGRCEVGRQISIASLLPVGRAARGYGDLEKSQTPRNSHQIRGSRSQR